jgi:GNAT superfamily N-acetyltransferase
MERAFPTPAVAADASAVSEVVVALESSLYGQSTFSQADLEDEWSDLDLERDARVVRDGDRIVGYGAMRELGELWRAEGYVHPEALGRGIGKLIATGLEEDAARRGARRIQNRSLGLHAPRFRVVVEGPPRERALRPDALVRRPRRGRDRRRDDLHGRHVRRRLCPRALHASPVGQAGRRRGAARRLLRALLGARRAQRRARRRRGERHRRVPPLRARRDGARARLGDVREGARRCCVSRAPGRELSPGSHPAPRRCSRLNGAA